MKAKGLNVAFLFIVFSCNTTGPTSHQPPDTFGWNTEPKTYAHIIWEESPGSGVSAPKDTIYSGTVIVTTLSDTMYNGLNLKKLRTIYISNPGYRLSLAAPDTNYDLVYADESRWTVYAFSNAQSHLLLKMRAEAGRDTIYTSEEPYNILRFPLNQGAFWITDSLYKTEKTVIGIETIQVPAGELNCYRIHCKLQTVFQLDGFVSEEWYSEKGLAKQVLCYGDASLLQDNVRRYELLERTE